MCRVTLICDPGIVFAFTLGNITSLISTTSGANLRFEQKLISLKEYLDFRNMETDYKRQVLNAAKP